MATIEKRKQTADGDATYRVRIRIQGLPEKQKTFKRLTDASEFTPAGIRPLVLRKRVRPLTASQVMTVP